MKKGLIMVNTGDGKGKTTAALGLAMRAAGHNLKVCFIQFIKGSWNYGEITAIKQLKAGIDFHVMGKGFTWKSKDLEKDKQFAKEGWEFARQAISSDAYDVVILDELTYLLKYKIIDLDTVLKTLEKKPKNLHVMITGRGAPQELIDAADLVTEMRLIKHPFDKGINAQKGIEF